MASQVSPNSLVHPTVEMHAVHFPSFKRKPPKHCSHLLEAYLAQPPQDKESTGQQVVDDVWVSKFTKLMPEQLPLLLLRWALGLKGLPEAELIFEGSLEVKLPTIWTDEKQSREEAERRERLEERRSEEKESEERRCRCAKR